jgi:hypothetical protein
LNRAVKIARAIDEHAGLGIRPIGILVVGTMQYLSVQPPARFGRQLEHRTVLVVLSANKGRRAVEVAGGIDDQAAIGLEPRPRQSYAAPSLEPPPALGIDWNAVPGP